MTSFGKYMGHDTFFHRIDARIKLLGMIFFMVSIFLSYGTPWMSFVIYGVIFLILLTITFVSKASFLSLFRSMKALWFMILLILIINIFFTTDTTSQILVQFPGTNICIRLGAVVNVSYIFLRLVLVLMITNILTSTTKPMDLTNAIEWLFHPLSWIRIPVHKFAMALSLALRFVPSLQEETTRIMKAQASRGVDFQNGNFKTKIKSLVSLIIPLFISAFLTSGELADAMEARGYDPDSKRTKFKNTNWSLKDTCSAVFLTLFLAGIITMAVCQFDLFAALGVQVPQL